MKLDLVWFWAFLVVLARAGALISVAPVFGSRGVPVSVRVGLSAVLALGLAPVLQERIGAPPDQLLLLGLRIGYELLVGLAMGYAVSVLVAAAEMAGEWLDLHIGYGFMQLLNPLTAFPASLLAQFHYLLALVLFTLVEGHHFLLIGLVKSFELQAPVGGLVHFVPTGLDRLGGLITQAMLLALQIAAPAGAVLIVVDAAMAFLSRAVPQVPIWLVTAPAKIALGLIALSAGLPILVWAALRMSEWGVRIVIEIGRML